MENIVIMLTDITNSPHFTKPPLHLALSTNLLLIVLTSVILIILKLFNAILEPMNYELDMTTRDYCKPVAEIDNSLRFQSIGQKRITKLDGATANGAQLRLQSVDCAADLPTNTASSTISDAIKHDENNNANLDPNETNTAYDSCTQPNGGSTEHVYPNGWIPVMESHKLKRGSVRRAIILGCDVIVTRSFVDDSVSVLDAYCPHMGVHIGIAGQVKQVGDQTCVECPFHRWAFRTSDGQCVDIPYQKKCSIPKQAKLNTWHCVEIDNFIYIWHHIDNEPPNWFMKPSEELARPDWQLAGRSCHETNLEIRDMHENGADMNHFEGIHNDLFIFGGEISKLKSLASLQEYTRHHWNPNWQPVIDDSGRTTHMARMKLQSWISIFGIRVFDITVRALQIGPARVNLYYNSEWYGSGLLIMNAIPRGGRRTRYVQHIYTRQSLFQCFMAKWVLYGEIKMLERDFVIWNHKKNIKNPIFVPEDRTLKQFRKWYMQFYRRKRKITTRDTNVIDCHNDDKPIRPNLEF